MDKNSIQHSLDMRKEIDQYEEANGLLEMIGEGLNDTQKKDEK